ncbi:MAG: HD domain-containing protein [Lachnospiraceae bacterium]|nr:HD domain-containing protein [Lachnospiraceae bacterium]
MCGKYHTIKGKKQFRCFCFLCLIGWMIAFSGVYAKESGVDQWIKTVYNENNGLDTGEANVVLQTSDGYIWIGSYGGLLRYNGRDFENFSIGENAVGSSSIRALYEDESGRLFIGTNDVGVYVYENGVFTSVSCADGETGFYSVRSFISDQNGTVYVGTTSGLAQIVFADETEESEMTGGDTGEETAASGCEMVPINGTEGRVVYDLTCDSAGVVWGCADNSKLLLVSDGALLGTLSADAWLESDCYSVYCASDGCIYLGSGGSEAVRLHQTGDGYTTADFAAEEIDTGELYAVNRFYETADGTIWGLCDNGIAQIDESDTFQTPDGMSGMISCCAMIEDYEGNIWVASSRTGLTYYSEGRFYNYNDRAGLEGVAVNAIVRCEGYTYLGTDSGLILLDEEMLPIENELTEMMDGKRVRHINCDSSGTFWFCVYGTGLVQYIPESGEIRLLTEEDGLLGNQVRLTLELSDGTIAVGGSNGINILKDGVVIRSYGSDVLPYSFILCMYEAEDGTLIAGSDGQGIYEITADGEVTQYYKEAGLASGSVMRMVPDEDGVWISAGSALYYRDADGIREIVLTESVGSILDILVIDDEVWLMKSSGLLIADREELLAGTASPRNLSTEYGLTGTLVANSWNWQDEDGTLWLCTNNGISVIDTEEVPANEQEPRGAISKVTVDGVEMAVSDSLTIPASATRITFELSVLSFTPGDKTVEYTLEGFDEEASVASASSITAVNYTNLGGGDYVFRFTACNEDGVEGEEISITIHKESHFWETAWFLALVFLAILAGVLLVILLVSQIRVRSMKKRQEELKLIIEQSLHTFANAIDAKDSDTNGHSVRVANYSREIARRMNFSVEEQEQISYMALLHDIGKIGIPDSILKKAGKLTPEEWEIVKSHPRIGGEILSEFTVIPDIADGAKYHHEHYDGNGYCEGRKGEEIPLKARIIAVADSFDAMCSARHYQAGNTLEYAREELLRCSGTQFDPDIVGYMVDMIDDGFVKQG